MPREQPKGMSTTNILLLILVIFFVAPVAVCGACTIGVCTPACIGTANTMSQVR